jgi:hypothetical protein
LALAQNQRDVLQPLLKGLGIATIRDPDAPFLPKISPWADSGLVRLEQAFREFLIVGLGREPKKQMQSSFRLHHLNALLLPDPFPYDGKVVLVTSIPFCGTIPSS